MMRILLWVMQISGLLLLGLGILFWTGNAGSLVALHIALGIILTLALWAMGFLVGTGKGGNVGLMVGAFVMGLILVLFGLNQSSILTGSSHWIVEVIHLLLGIAAVGFGNVINRRYKGSQTLQIS